jgi:hypothetical protein
MVNDRNVVSIRRMPPPGLGSFGFLGGAVLRRLPHREVLGSVKGLTGHGLLNQTRYIRILFAYGISHKLEFAICARIVFDWKQ